MAFTVEDGTGLDNSNSYASVEFADDWASLRGNESWENADEAQKEQALVRATDYLDQYYAARWIGSPLSANQARAWPRDNIGIPVKLKQACCMLAIETIDGADLNPVQGRAVKREKVDVIEVEYMDNARTGSYRAAIDQMLYGLIAGGGLNAKVVRV